MNTHPLYKSMLRLPQLGTLAALMISTPSWSQESQAISLEEVLVTSERIEANLQDSPVAVTAFSSQQIEKLGAQGIEDLRSFVPNFTISEDGDYGRMNPSFNIRGVGSGVPSAGVVTEKAVGLYVDGIYLARAQGSLLSVIDAQSIEVLRGPQGTLFGRNATGGAVSYTSKKPTNEFESSVDLTLGSDSRRDATLSINAPISDKVFFRGVLHDGSIDGFVDRGGIDLGNRDESVVRAQLRIEATEDVTIDLSASHSTFETNGDSRVITEFVLEDGALNTGHFKALESLIVAQGGAPFVTNDPRIVGEFSAPAFCVLDDTDPYTSNELCEHPVDAKMDIFSANIDWAISEQLSLKSLTGFTDGNQTASTDFPWSGAYTRPFTVEFDSFQQEFQLLYQTDRLDFVAGAIYYTENGQEDEITIANSENFIPYRISQEDVLAGVIQVRRDETYTSETKSYGLFAQSTYSLTERLKATAGIRYSKDEKTVDIVYRPTPQDPKDVGGSGSESWDDVDYRIALSYAFNDDVMVYVSLSDAYKAGIAVDSSLENRSNVNNEIGFVDPEEAVGFEIGLRSEWMDNRLRANLTAFQTDYSNRQAATIVQIGDSVFFDTINIGDVEYEGLEGEFAFAATEALTFTFSFGLVDYEQILEPDFALSYVPESSYALGLVHYAELSSGGNLTSSLNYGWTDKMYNESEATKDGSARNQAEIPAYGILNGRIDYVSSDDKWSIGLFVNNMTDEYYWTSASPQSWHFGLEGLTDDWGTTANLGRPRSYGITGKFNF